jgi:hypothetical protein
VERSAPHDRRMHDVMAAAAALIIVASASAPVPEPSTDVLVDDAALTGEVEAAFVDDGASGARPGDRLGGLNRAPVTRPAVHPRDP